MTKLLPFSYRPDGRLNCPWPLSMVAYSLHMYRCEDEKEQEYLYQRQMQAQSIANTHRIQQEMEHPDGVPEPEYPSGADNRDLYKWKWGKGQGSALPEMILSMLWEFHNDQVFRARVLFAEAARAFQADPTKLPPEFHKYDLFVVYGVKILGIEEGTDRTYVRARAVMDIDDMIMFQPSGLGAPQEAVLIFAGVVDQIRLMEEETQAEAA